MFIEIEGKDSEKTAEEIEADELGAEYLLSQSVFKKWASSQTDFNTTNISLFAEQQGIAPGIIVGRLQHLGAVGYATNLNKLKARYKWED